jgi:3-dehydroquinate dehydratase-2
MRLMILNGPNLNLLGVREPHIYGSTTLAGIQASCEEFARLVGAQLSFHQSNHEGVLVDLIQSARRMPMRSSSIQRATRSPRLPFSMLKVFEGPIFEVHISNIHARDELHRQTKLVRCQSRNRGPWTVRLHRRDAGRIAGDGQAPESLPAPLRLGPR